MVSASLKPLRRLHSLKTDMSSSTLVDLDVSKLLVKPLEFSGTTFVTQTSPTKRRVDLEPSFEPMKGNSSLLSLTFTKLSNGSEVSDSNLSD